MCPNSEIVAQTNFDKEILHDHDIFCLRLCFCGHFDGKKIIKSIVMIKKKADHVSTDAFNIKYHLKMGETASYAKA